MPVTREDKNPLNAGDLRASKGAFLFIPEGTKRHLRVQPEAKLEAGFMSKGVELVLSQSVKSYVETDRFEAKIDPEHGIPEQICGNLLGPCEEGFLLQSGSIRLVVELPQAPKSEHAMVFCDMSGPLIAKMIKETD
jgi:hypothetical protein